MKDRGFRAEFNLSNITKQIGKVESEIEEGLSSVLSYIGEQFINDARRIDTYTDDTGNLRASIGYAILNNGRRVSFVTKETNNEAIRQSKSLVDELRSENNKGYVLIVFAGMEYAAWVESKGYDVITGSAPSSKQVESDLKELLGGINI